MRRLRSPRTRYRPLARLAAGGMAEVWSGEAILDGGEVVPVAIKRVLPHMMNDRVFLDMFEDEARLGMLLDHERIVRVFDARNIGGTYLMIMELVLGDTLKGVLDPAFAGERPMPLVTALHVARELASGLAYAHAAVDERGRPLGVIHRDVSPHNLLLGVDGSVKLSDFGLADSSVSVTERESGVVGGKLAYLAPEVFLHERHDHRVDLFALGVVLWEMLAGQRLFHGRDDRETVRRVVACEVPSLARLNPAVPCEVDRVVRDILAADPDRRYRRGAHIVEALDALLDWLDAGGAPRDVSLLVSMHLAAKARTSPVSAAPLGVAELLAAELEEFQRTAVDESDFGASPLDPGVFEGRGFVRRR